VIPQQTLLQHQLGYETLFTQNVTNTTFIFETSPNTKPKEKKVGGHSILCPPRLKKWGVTSPLSPTKLRACSLVLINTWTHSLKLSDVVSALPIAKPGACVPESCAGRVNPRRLRVPAFAGRVREPALHCVRVRGGLNLLRGWCRLYLLRVRGGRGFRNLCEGNWVLSQSTWT